MHRTTNLRIPNIDNFITQLQETGTPHVLLQPLPIKQNQIGPTCGYYALSIITHYWHSVHPSYRAFPARKCDSKTGEQSLRFFGKNYNKDKDAIYDMEIFKQLSDDLGYQADIHTFETFPEFAKIVKEKLNKGIPIILPVDLAKRGDAAIALNGGATAHYITLIGYVEITNQLDCIVTSDDHYYLVSAEMLFVSCDYLKEKPEKIKFEKNKDTLWTITQIEPAVDLSKLRNHLVAIEPKLAKENICIIPKPVVRNIDSSAAMQQYDENEVWISEINNIEKVKPSHDFAALLLFWRKREISNAAADRASREQERLKLGKR